MKREESTLVCMLDIMAWVVLTWMILHLHTRRFNAAFAAKIKESNMTDETEIAALRVILRSEADVNLVESLE